MIHIILFGISTIFLFSYIFIGMNLYNKKELEKFDLRNHFCYEMWIKKDTPNAYISFLLFASLVVFSGNFIYYAIYNFNALSAFLALASLLFAFSSGVLFILPLSKLKERCTFSILLFTSSILLNALLVYQGVRLYIIYASLLSLVPIILNGLIFILGIVAIFTPRLFDFSYERDSDGALKRRKIIPLAFYEWLVIIFTFFSAISLTIFTFIYY